MKGKRRGGQGGKRLVPRRKSILYRHKKSVMVICAVLGLLMGVLGAGSVRLCAKIDSYKQQEAELQSQIEEAKKRAEEIKAYEEYVQTDDYVKDVAEEKLGLVDPEDIVFKPQE